MRPLNRQPLHDNLRMATRVRKFAVMIPTNRPKSGRLSIWIGLAALCVAASLVLSLSHVTSAPAVGHDDCQVCLAMHSTVLGEVLVACHYRTLIESLPPREPSLSVHRSPLSYRGRAPPLSFFV